MFGYKIPVKIDFTAEDAKMMNNILDQKNSGFKQSGDMGGIIDRSSLHKFISKPFYAGSVQSSITKPRLDDICSLKTTNKFCKSSIFLEVRGSMHTSRNSVFADGKNKI